MNLKEAHAAVLSENRFLDANDFWRRVAGRAGLSVKETRKQAAACGLASPPSQRTRQRF